MGGINHDRRGGRNLRPIADSSVVARSDAATRLSADHIEDIIMRHTTLYMKLGRAAPKPLCTVNDAGPNAEQILIAQETRSMQEAIAGGNDPLRIEFSRETVEVAKAEQPVARSTGRKR